MTTALAKVPDLDDTTAAELHPSCHVFTTTAAGETPCINPAAWFATYAGCPHPHTYLACTGHRGLLERRVRCDTTGRLLRLVALGELR